MIIHQQLSSFSTQHTSDETAKINKHFEPHLQKSELLAGWLAGTKWNETFAILSQSTCWFSTLKRSNNTQ